MRNAIICVIFLAINTTLMGQVKIDETMKQAARETNYLDFFNSMASNEYPEKIVKNNYYLFDTIAGFLYYGKMKPGIISPKITAIYKTNINKLQEEIPDYKKLNGYILRNIVIAEILKTNELTNQNEIIIKDIRYNLEKNIIMTILYGMRGETRQEHYCLSTNDFKIIHELQVRNFSEIPKEILEQLDKIGIDDSLLLNRYESIYLNVVFETTRKDFDFTDKKIGFITGSNGGTISNKANYFRLEKDRFNQNSTTNGGVLYIFNAEQKAESGGYDAAIVYWSKVLVPINKVVERLKKEW